MHSVLSASSSFLEEVCLSRTISGGQLHRRMTSHVATEALCPVTPFLLLDFAVLKFLITFDKRPLPHTCTPAPILIWHWALQSMSPVLKSAFLVLLPRCCTIFPAKIQETVTDGLLWAGGSYSVFTQIQGKPGSEGSCMVKSLFERLP